LADADEGRGTDAPIKQPGTKPVRSVWGIDYIKRQLQEHATKKKEETPSDKAARITATATKWMAGFTFILALFTGGTLLILRSQLWEMRGGGIDTHDLAIAAKAQADRTKELAESAKTSANAAKSAADTAARALYITEAADMEADHFECLPEPLSTESSVSLILRNTGRTSATNVENYVYVGFYGDTLRKLGKGSVATVGAGTWIPAGVLRVGDTVRDFTAINNGTQKLHLWGWVKYSDRFDHAHIFLYDAEYIPKTPCRFNIVNIVSR